jgi:hypothetical protein
MFFALVLPGRIQAQTTNRISTLVNFNTKGLQITRFDSVAAAIDARDGGIAYFNGVFYLYGTSYGCGYQWGSKGSPFCGFKAFSSKDLVNWTAGGGVLILHSHPVVARTFLS